MEVQKAASSPRFILRYLENSIPCVPGTELSLENGISDAARKYLALTLFYCPNHTEDYRNRSQYLFKK